jgi:hypothetical protein
VTEYIRSASFCNLIKNDPREYFAHDAKKGNAYVVVQIAPFSIVFINDDELNSTSYIVVQLFL